MATAESFGELGLGTNPTPPRSTPRAGNGWVARLFPARPDLDGRSVRQMILSLNSQYAAIAAGGKEIPESIRSEFEAVMTRYNGETIDWTDPRAWDDAYLCERLLVEMMEEPRLEVELERRILDAQALGLPAAEFYRGRLKTAADMKDMVDQDRIKLARSLLARLTLDLQWYYNQLDLKRRYAHRAQKRVSWLFLVSLILFGAVMSLTFGVDGPPPTKQVAQEGR